MSGDRRQARVELTIPFHDVDMMGVAWHGHYARYFELAREAVLNQIGFGYKTMRDTGYAWPIIDFQVRYRHALHHEQKVLVSARIGDYENHLCIEYEIRDAASNQRLTTAQTRQVAVDMATGEICLASPQALLDRMVGL
ncbi:acyl-CoA thioesterase [Castellaniella caeni]|uniref:acyl-CoA thioesterase n=1 Tax=Castellaniella caeni TaxID=266123 RepID=UPI00082ACD93|nr:thioesterase family protein [Castellaniella caeni]